MAALSIIFVLLAVPWLAALVWSLYVILTTAGEIWDASGMSQLLWLAVVLVMPLVGSLLFLAVGRQRLADGASQAAPTAEAPIR